VPAFVSTLCICIVFVPIFFLSGVTKYLFSPLAMAVIFAMLASYFFVANCRSNFCPLSARQAAFAASAVGPGLFQRNSSALYPAIRAIPDGLCRLAAMVPGHRKIVLIAMGFAALMTRFLLVTSARISSAVDAGSFRLHVRAPAGTRIEETERIFSKVEDDIRTVIPSNELETILDNIGLPNSSLNLANGDMATIGPADGEILVSLNPENHHSTWVMSGSSGPCEPRFSAMPVFTQSSDIVGQILNFGLPAPIDIQIAGRDRESNYALARELAHRVAMIPGRCGCTCPPGGRRPYFQ